MEIKLTKNNFDQVVMNNELPVLVDFWATWCGPCRMIAPIVKEIAEQYEGKVVVGKVDVDEEDELAIKYSIMSIPTLLIFKNGAVVDKIVGYQTKSVILSKLGL